MESFKCVKNMNRNQLVFDVSMIAIEREKCCNKML